MDEEIGSTRWFGPSWGAPVCKPGAQVFLPANTSCAGCLGEIGVEESGIRLPHLGAYREFSYYHLDCFLEVVGISRSSDTVDHE